MLQVTYRTEGTSRRSAECEPRHCVYISLAHSSSSRQCTVTHSSLYSRRCVQALAARDHHVETHTTATTSTVKSSQMYAGALCTTGRVMQYTNSKEDHTHFVAALAVKKRVHASDSAVQNKQGQYGTLRQTQSQQLSEAASCSRRSLELWNAVSLDERGATLS